MDSSDKKPETHATKGEPNKSLPVTPTFTDEELVLGKKALRTTDIIYALGAIVCIAIAVFVMTQVPWETRHPVPTKRGHYMPMQIAFSAPLLMIAMFRGRRKSEDHHMKKGSRRAVIVFALVLCSLMVWAQLHMMNEIFDSVAVSSNPTGVW